MKKNLITMMIASVGVLCINCTEYLACYVDAIGEHPSNKTYFVESRFPEELNPLVIKEYLNELDITMSHLGYAKVDSIDAANKLVFGYNVGDVTQGVSSFPVYQYNPQTQTTTNSTIKDASGKELAKVNATTSSGNEWGSINYVGERTSTTSEQQITLILDAFDVKTKEPIWSVRVNNKMSLIYSQDLRKWMPLYLLDMYPYIGTNSGSGKFSAVSLKDKRLRWFNPKTQE